MSLIEKAAQRLDQLKQATAEPDDEPAELQSVPAAALAVEASAEALVASDPVSRSSAPPLVQPQLRAAPVSRSVTIDLAMLHEKGLVTPDHPRSTIAEEFRVIKRPLIANASSGFGAGGARSNLVMVTSAMPDEGKTFCAVNLALSIAMELDRTVLLVDADVARPSLPRVLGLPDLPGLFDVLEGRVADVGEVLHPTNVEKLSFLASGTLNPRAPELLASESMAALLEELAGRHPDRIVVFDSPPLLVTTEANELAAHMGQVVLVALAGRTQHAEVKRAVAATQSCPARFMVLNQARPEGASGYGYGYGYGYAR